MSEERVLIVSYMVYRLNRYLIFLRVYLQINYLIFYVQIIFRLE